MFIKKKVLVTGAAGFIGSHMCDLLLSKKKYHVFALDNLSGGNLKNINHLKNNKNFKFIKKDLLSNYQNKYFLNVDYVIHFAGIGDIVPSIENPKKYILNNFNATLNLLNNLNFSRIKKFVYAASSSCYGITKTPTNENQKINPIYPYALSKYLGEQICMHWHKVYDAKINSIRIFNAYGIRSRTNGAYGAVMGTFLRQIISKKELTIVGNGKQKRDFIYVTDLVNAFYKAMISKHNGKVWNAGYGKPRSINNLVKLLNYSKKIYIPNRPGEPVETFADISKIKKDLNWKPKISLEKGIKFLLNNLDDWRSAPLWTKKKINKATKSWFKYLGTYDQKKNKK
jgi:UDP-glucose 4-epimerase